MGLSPSSKNLSCLLLSLASLSLLSSLPHLLFAKKHLCLHQPVYSAFTWAPFNTKCLSFHLFWCKRPGDLTYKALIVVMECRPVMIGGHRKSLLQKGHCIISKWGDAGAQIPWQTEPQRCRCEGGSCGIYLTRNNRAMGSFSSEVVK